MSPSAQPATPTAEVNSLAERMLEEGEIIILAVRPSGWFILIESLPIILVCVLAGLASMFSHLVFPDISESSRRVMLTFCGSIVLARMIIAAVQWAGRLYILTNHRIMTVMGVIHVQIFQCPLTHIHNAELTSTLAERFFGLGTVLFLPRDSQDAPPPWTTLARPEEILKKIVQELSRGGGQ